MARVGGAGLVRPVWREWCNRDGAEYGSGCILERCRISKENGLDMNGISKQALAGLIVAIVCCCGVYGQQWTTTYTLPNGVRYTISYTVSIGGGGSVYVGSPFWLYPERLEVIEGPDVELETLEGKSVEHPDQELAVYRPLDLARDLMRGRISARGPDGYLHACSNPDCEYQEEPIVDYDRKTVIGAAIGAYGIHLKDQPEDWMVVRELAVAFLEAKQFHDAKDIMHEAYLTRPEMGKLPISEVLLGESPKAMRELVVWSVKWAHREPSAEAWLLVSVLMQSQGKIERAREMLIRAHDLGLEEEIFLNLDASMS